MGDDKLEFDKGGRVTRETMRRLLKSGKKYCAKCELVRPIGAFFKRDGRPHGLSVWCKDCKRADDRRHAARRYQERKGEIKQGRADLKAHYTSRLGGECPVCGWSEPIDLTFHHVNPEEKKHDIGYMLHPDLVSVDREAEVDKCGVLCFRHHRHLEQGRIGVEWERADFGYRLSDWWAND